MKKLSIAMSAMACAALVLSGCGNSVSDDRAEAYASLSSMTSLSSSQAQEYKQRLTVAPDSAAYHPKQGLPSASDYIPARERTSN